MAGTSQNTKRGAGFLTRPEVVKCKQVAESKAGIYSQRAAALLALHEGLTQKETAEKCKLTLTQISYLKTSFKVKRMAIFPVDLSNPKKTTPVKTATGSVKKSALKQTKEKAKEEKKEKSKKIKKSEGKKSKKKTGKKDKKDKKKKSKKDKKKKK